MGCFGGRSRRRSRGNLPSRNDFDMQPLDSKRLSNGNNPARRSRATRVVQCLSAFLQVLCRPLATCIRVVGQVIFTCLKPIGEWCLAPIIQKIVRMFGLPEMPENLLKLLKEFVFGLIINPTDIATDIHAAYIHFVHGEALNCISTLAIVFMPLVMRTTLNIISWTLWRQNTNEKEPKWDFFLHIPFVNIYHNYKMMKRLSALMKDKEDWMNIIDKFEQDQDIRDKICLLGWQGSFSGKFVRMSRVEMNTLLSKLDKDDQFEDLDTAVLEQIDIDDIQKDLDGASYVPKDVALLKLMNITLKKKQQKVIMFHTKMATFQLYEGLFESTPQALLQSSIQMRDNIFFNDNAHWTDMLTVIISVISTVSASATLYLRKPQIKNWKVTNRDYSQTAPEENLHLLHQTFKNYLWVFPCLTLVTIPRVLSITYFISRFMIRKDSTSNSLNVTLNCTQHKTTNVTDLNLDILIKYVFCATTVTIFFVAFSVSFFLAGICLGIKKREIKRKSIYCICLGVLSPCIVLHPKSRLLMVTSLTSAIFHTILCIVLLTIKSPAVATYNFAVHEIDDTVLLYLIVCLNLSLIPSYFLHIMSFEDKRQNFGLFVKLGSLCCEEKYALIWACENNYTTLLKRSKPYLHQPKNSEQFQKNELGYNPVQIACVLGYVGVLETLRGFEDYMQMLEEKEVGGKTAFLLACQHGQYNIAKILIDEGEADIEAKDGGNRNSFMLACQNGHLNIVNMLLGLPEERKVDINNKTKTGFTAFMIACEGGHLDVLNTLLQLPKEWGVRLDDQTDKGYTGFMIACWHGQLNIVKRLLELPDERHAAVNMKSSKGYTGFMIACEAGHKNIVSYLLGTSKERANINLEDEEAEAGAQIAIQNGHLEVAEVIQQHKK